jgi:hypothetical protein
MEATTHETVLTDTSATSRAEKAPGQENRTVWNTKSDHPVSQEVAATLGRQQEQETPNGSSVDQQGSIQGKTGPRSKALANDEAKPDAERGLEEVTTEQDKVPGDRGQDRSRDQLTTATKPDSPVSKTRPYGFGSLRTEANIEDYRAWDNSRSSLVSSRTHAQPEEDDSMDESVKVEGGRDREGKRRIL